MELLKIIRYKPRHPILKKIIKFYWFLKSDSFLILKNTMLPVNNIDIVLNFASPIKYISESRIINAQDFHFNGIRLKSNIIYQTGKLNTFGISFYPAGLYPFIKIPLSEFTDKTIELNYVIKNLGSKIKEILLNSNINISYQIEKIEKYLLNIINYDEVISKKHRLIINSFYSNIFKMSIKGYCIKYQVNPRKLERLYNKYIGVSPKLFQKISRFQNSVNQIIDNNYSELTSVAYENEYYDQAHFIKDFKSFTGSSPSQFIKNRISMKEILKYEYS